MQKSPRITWPTKMRLNDPRNWRVYLSTQSWTDIFCMIYLDYSKWIPELRMPWISTTDLSVCLPCYRKAENPIIMTTLASPPTWFVSELLWLMAQKSHTMDWISNSVDEIHTRDPFEWLLGRTQHKFYY